MSAPCILLIVIIEVTLLLMMVLKFKLSAFIALLITSIFVEIMETIISLPGLAFALLLSIIVK